MSTLKTDVLKDVAETVSVDVVDLAGAVTLRQDLADFVNPVKGASLVSFAPSLAYPSGTVGNVLKSQAATVTSHTAQLQALNTAIVTPQQFGAVSDGTSHPLSEFYATLAEAQVVYPHATALTDETDWAACQSAINNSRSVFFGDSSKSYYINKILVPRDESAYTGLKAKLFQSNVGFEVFDKTEITDVLFMGLSLVGSSPNPIVADGTNRAIQLFGPTNVRIEKCEFLNWGSAGVFLSGKGAAEGPVNCSIVGNHFDNCNDAIFFYVGGYDNLIHGNTILNCGRGGVFLDDVSLSDAGQPAVPARRVVVSNNTIRGYGGWTAGYGITTGYAEDCEFVNNIISGGTGDAISMFAGGTSADAPLPSDGNLISGNHITDVAGWGIVLVGSTNNTISNNVLTDCWLNTAAGARAFIQCQVLTRNATTVGSSGNLIVGNHLRKVAAGSDMDYGIRYDAGCDNNHAFNNRIIGATTSAILDQGTGNTAANNPVT